MPKSNFTLTPTRKTIIVCLTVGCIIVVAGSLDAAEPDPQVRPLPRNLLSNGDAEQGTVGQKPPVWHTSGYDGAKHVADSSLRTVTGGRNNSKAISFERPGTCQWVLMDQFPYVLLAEPARYVLTAWLKSDRALGKAVDLAMIVSVPGAKGRHWQARQRFEVDTTWKQVSLPITLPASLDQNGKPRQTTLRSIVQLYAQGTLLIDDVSLAPQQMSAREIAEMKMIQQIMAKTDMSQSPVGMRGGIIARPDGTLLAFSSDFAVCRSTDGGTTWTGPEPLAIDDQSDNITGAIQMRDGTIGIHTESWGSPLYFWRSSDGGKTWTKRIQIGPKGAPLHGNVMIETRDGRLIIPCREGHTVHGGLWKDAGAGGTINGEWVMTEGHAHALEMDIGFVYYSTDGGNSWQRNQGDIIVWKDDGYGGMWPVDEPNVAQLNDGRLIMLARTTLGRLYQSFSSDGGATWSYPEATDLPSSYSPCCLQRVPENKYTLKTGRAGDLLVVWNNVSVAEIKRGFRRGRLSCAVSKDDGETWIHVKTLDTAGLPAIKGLAPVSEPQMARADKDLGELPIPFGNVDYADITFAGDRVLIKYHKKFTNPPGLSFGTPLRIEPLDWVYED